MSRLGFPRTLLLAGALLVAAVATGTFLTGGLGKLTPASAHVGNNSLSFLHICVTPSGVVRVVAPSVGGAYACSLGEKVYHLPTSAVVGPPGPPGPEGDSGAEGPAGPQVPAVLTGGSSPDTMGCIACDGAGRVLGPGVSGMGVGGGTIPRFEVPLPAGTLKNLRVQQSFADGSNHGYSVIVNGVGAGIGCSIIGGASYCESGASAHINNGDRVALTVGNPGVFGGGFYVKWSVEFEPDPPAPP